MSKQNLVGAVPSTASDEAEVRELLESAGHRPAVPAEELARLRTAAREQWRETVRLERERSRFGRKNTMLAMAASLLLAVVLGWWLMPQWRGVAPDMVARVELVRGDLFSGGARVAPGADLSAGSVLETGTEGSGAALRLGGSQSVRLDRGTRVRMTSGASFELESGGVYVDTHDAAPGAGIEVSTAFGRLRDIGTQFSVRLGDRDTEQLTVRVREGEVVFEAASTRRAARAGEELTLRRGSEMIEKTAIERHGDAWEWVEAVTPAMDIEGAPLSEYLEWVSRETGRELRYADGALARSAETITLSGSIEDLTPEESLAILPGSGLGSRLEDGLLVIEQPQP